MALQLDSVVRAITDILSGPPGLKDAYVQARLEAGEPGRGVEAVEIARVHLPGKLSASTGGHRYPAVYVYVSRIDNSGTEKFARVSGTCTAVVEIRMSASRGEDLTRALHMLTESTLELLGNQRGTWDCGVTYGGEYSVVFEGPQVGGQAFEQTAKISLPLYVHR